MSFNILRPRQNGWHHPDDIFKYIFLNENIWISIKFSLKFVPMGSINNISALVQIMAWRRPGDKPLCEPMMNSLLTHICVTRPQWVKLFVPVAASLHIELPNLLWCKHVVPRQEVIHSHYPSRCHPSPHSAPDTEIYFIGYMICAGGYAGT